MCHHLASFETILESQSSFKHAYYVHPVEPTTPETEQYNLNTIICSSRHLKGVMSTVACKNGVLLNKFGIHPQCINGGVLIEKLAIGWGEEFGIDDNEASTYH